MQDQKVVADKSQPAKTTSSNHLVSYCELTVDCAFEQGSVGESGWLKPVRLDTGWRLYLALVPVVEIAAKRILKHAVKGHGRVARQPVRYGKAGAGDEPLGGCRSGAAAVRDGERLVNGRDVGLPSSRSGGLGRGNDLGLLVQLNTAAK